jgi:flagellar hook-associated protein 2
VVKERMSNLRISGLASGMDTEKMVSDLMKAARMPLDKIKQKKQILEWQRDDYRSMNTLLLDFRSQLTQMKLTSQYRVRTTTSTNETKVTATASSAAGLTSSTIQQVTQLASAESIKNNGNIFNDSSFDSSKGLFEQKQKFSYFNPSDPTTNVWKQGAIESSVKNIATDHLATGTGREIPFDELGITNVDSTLDTANTWSIKVNGQGYKVVSSTTPGENEVYIDTSTRKIKFGKDIIKDTQIRVDYVAANKEDSLTLKTDTKTWQLSHGSIYNDPSSPITLTYTDGTNPSETWTVDSSGNIYKADGTTNIGNLNFETGTITFNNNNMSSSLPTSSSDLTKSLKINYKQNYTNFYIDTYTKENNTPKLLTESFLVQGNESLNSVIGRVNGSKVGVNMFYDNVTNQMTLTRSSTGDFNLDDSTTGTYYREIITGSDGSSGGSPGGFINGNLRFYNSIITNEGKDATFKINGIETYRSSNTFEMNGVTYTLKNLFNNGGTEDPANYVTINVNNDTNKVYDNIKAFVDKYNDLVDKIQKKIGEERYKSYTPLTDDQRETLSDKQQEQWEEKAKSGLLKRDPLLSGALDKMRMNIYQPVLNDSVSTLTNQLAEIGISTTSNYLEGGKLEINEAKLKKAIADDPTSVENLFRIDGVTDSQKGVVQRLYNSVSNVMDDLKEKAGNSYSVNNTFVIGKQLDDYDKQISRFEDRLKQTEDRYWRQFTAMEKAIQQANSQATYLANQFGGGN